MVGLTAVVEILPVPVEQTAATLVLSLISEADLEPEQYAYRPGRGAHDAVRRVHRLLNTGHREVVDADLTNYFGEIEGNVDAGGADVRP